MNGTPPTPGTPKIALADVRKSFNSKQVLRGIDLEVMPGESLVVIGGSGTGKSVMLKCILGLLRPDGGSIRIDGEETIGLGTGDRRRLMKKFGMLFQGAALFDSLKVWEKCRLRPDSGRAHGPRRGARRRDRQVGKMSAWRRRSATCFRRSFPAACRKRVALARAIASDPEIIFFSMSRPPASTRSWAT